MKKHIMILSLMLLPLLASAQALVTGVDAAGVTYNATVNTEDDNTVTITGLATTGVTALNIPATITATVSGTPVTYTVSGIGAAAFSGNTTIESLIFEANAAFTTIGAKAFAGCTKISNDVVLPAGVNVIDDGIFAGCTQLRSIKFTTTAPIDFVNTTGDAAQGAFAGDKNLEYIDMALSTGRMSLPKSLDRTATPSGTTVADAYPFYNMPAHTLVYLPKDVTATYTFAATQPANAPATATTVPVTINSTLGSVVQPWTLVGYDYDGNGTYSMDEKPSWVTSVTMNATNGNANVAIDNAYQDVALPILTNMNNKLRDTPHVGNLGADPVDLSTHSVLTGKVTPMNTANSYVIAASGTYFIPLVYGNAIKDGAPNPSAYATSATGANVLSTFVDNAGNPITSPYIYDNHTIEGAKLVWADNASILDVTQIGISADGHNLRFRTTGDIVNGNAVVAVIGDGGKVLWSWHLWFTTNDALNIVNVKGLSGDTYGTTSSALGWVYTSGTGTTYTQRVVSVRVKQTGSNITQDLLVIQDGQQDLPRGNTTFYQWGRKDAFPGTKNRDEQQAGGGTFSVSVSNAATLGDGISNPNWFYYKPMNPGINGWCANIYLNLWSANNNKNVIGSDNSPVVKTVYDPSPVGFHVPAPDLFSGVSLASSYGTPNATNNFTNDAGYLFYTDPNAPSTSTKVFFPAAGFRDYNTGAIYTASDTGRYWSAMPVQAQNDPAGAYGIRMSINASTAYYVLTNNSIGTDCAASNGYSVRPVAE